MAAAIPLVATGVSMIGGAIGGKKTGPADAAAMQASQQGQTLFNFGMPRLNQAAGYYSGLLTGSRSQMTQAVQPEITATTDIYRGAERNLERSGVRGAQRDVAKAELGREQAGRIAGLVGGVRPMAAQQLAGLGGVGIQGAQGMGSLYANLLQQQQAAKEYNDKQSGALWGNIGKLLVGSYGAYKDWKAGQPGSYNPGGYSA